MAFWRPSTGATGVLSGSVRGSKRSAPRPFTGARKGSSLSPPPDTATRPIVSFPTRAVPSTTTAPTPKEPSRPNTVLSPSPIRRRCSMRRTPSTKASAARGRRLGRSDRHPGRLLHPDVDGDDLLLLGDLDHPLELGRPGVEPQRVAPLRHARAVYPAPRLPQVRSRLLRSGSMHIGRTDRAGAALCLGRCCCCLSGLTAPMPSRWTRPIPASRDARISWRCSPPPRMPTSGSSTRPSPARPAECSWPTRRSCPTSTCTATPTSSSTRSPTSAEA